ncbi:MAG: nucleotidyl transferase AbiEii/AbiGii toxin family protein [Pseudomonadota bacterium]
MQDLVQQERFEMEVLDRLNSGRFLRFFIFCGGTMLRLCHGLDRYSVDLDFWLIDQDQGKSVFGELNTFLSTFYTIKDAAEKFYTILFELRSPEYRRSLKIEIRKEHERPETEQAIAYSPHSTRQVLLQVVTLREMMALKTSALLDRGEIRDVYDMEFLVKRGIPPVSDREILHEVLRRINSFSKRDYSVKLGSLLEVEKRQYYREHNFRILQTAIQDSLMGS